MKQAISRPYDNKSHSHDMKGAASVSEEDADWKQSAVPATIMRSLQSGQFAPPQRQALVKQVGRQYGNREVQRLVSSLKHPTAAHDTKSSHSIVPQVQLKPLTDEEKAVDLQSPQLAPSPRLQSAFDNSPALKFGEKNEGVEKLQNALISLGFAMPISTRKTGSPDGVYGSETLEIVKKFQSDNGLTPDGEPGRNTLGAMDTKLLGTPPGPTPPGPTPPGPTPPGPVPPGPTPPTPTPLATAQVPTHIRSASSPAIMKDRITPRKDTDVTVKVTGFSPPQLPITLSIEGEGGGNGQATIDGGATASLIGDTTVKLNGTAQTDVGKGGNLHLVAKSGATELGRSDGFSVSAIPQNYTDSFMSALTGNRRGFIVQDGWESDSGTFADLDGAEISELVQYDPGTGCFSGAAPGNNSGYLPANSLTTDTHSRGVAELTSPGTLTASQACQFKDKRSGSVDIPMTNSGYLLKRVVFRSGFLGFGGLKITTSKDGAAVTAKGITSAAGVSTVPPLTQAV